MANSDTEGRVTNSDDRNSVSSVNANGQKDNGLSGGIETVEDVCNWLDSISLSQYTDSFRDNFVDGVLLITLSATELRDDLRVVNLHHRRRIMEAIDEIKNQRQGEAVSGVASDKSAIPASDKLPEHGRILDHLSNVRTYHSWLRVAVQFLSFAIVTIRLAPAFREATLVSTAAFYFAAVSVLAMVYAVYRYRVVVRMIEHSRLSSPAYSPDVVGAASLVILIMIASVLALVIIALPHPDNKENE